MNRILQLVFLVTLSSSLLFAKPVAKDLPRVFLLDAKILASQKQQFVKMGAKAPLAAAAMHAADQAMKEGPCSVMQKDMPPPTGDKHDYMSLAPYFWPDPKSPNGLPYIRRDGERNPEISKITDHHSLDDLENSVETLALAYYFKGDEAYAAKAVQLLRAFFLESATRMNPNLEYAQFIPGVN